MASDSKLASNPVTKEIESRIKQTPEHLFEVFLEIREPIDNEAPEVLLKYPIDFSDEALKTVTNFAYPWKAPTDEQGEYFAFAVLDPTGTLFRFGYCRRSNRDATCLCIISFYPWFETFYPILNDLATIISSKSTEDMEQFLSSLYNYKFISNDERKEFIEINRLFKKYLYTRPDTRKLPSMLTNRNFSVMCSRLGPQILLSLFAHLLFERRILFVSSKLFHLTACAYGCLHLIAPMHWQSIFLPILPSSMTWTTQCTAPYIIGIHTSVFSTLNMNELGDVVIVNIDEKKLETQYDDINSFPKYLSRSMKKGIQHASQLPGDHLARVFLRAMAFAVGNYANGFIIKNEKLDFDRDLYLEQYLGTHLYTFMSAIAHTQMFEQFSRYRTYVQLQRETDVDEFDLEVKNYQLLQQSKKFKTNKRIHKLFEKATNPLLEQVQSKAGKFQSAFNKAGQRVTTEAAYVRNHLTSLDINDVTKRTQTLKATNSNAKNRLSVTAPSLGSSNPDLLNEKSIPYQKFSYDDNISPFEPRLINGDHIDTSSSDSSRSSTPEPERPPLKSLISLENDYNPLLPSPIVLNVINTPLASPTTRPNNQIGSSSSDSSRPSTPESERPPLKSLISLENDYNPLLPSPIVLNVINTPLSSLPTRPVNQIDSKIKQLQSDLQHKVQTFDGKRLDPRIEYSQQTEIKTLVKQFDPLDDSNKIEQNSDDIFSSLPVAFRANNKSTPNISERHPSVFETIPTNRVNAVLKDIQTNYGTTTSRYPLQATQSVGQQNNLFHFSPALTARADSFPKTYPTMSNDLSSNFDPLASTDEKSLFSDSSSKSSSEINGSNLIDF